MIRKATLKRLERTPEQVFQEKCKAIMEILLQSTQWKQANVIAITISTKREIHTSSIIEQAWKEQKVVVVPKTNFQSKTMDFYQIQNWNEVEWTAHGLYEPISGKTTLFHREKIDLMIVPGVAFDDKGFRIGYGGGFYDRYLTDYNGKTIALATNEQMVRTLPHEAHDLPVQEILTESGWV